MKQLAQMCSAQLKLTLREKQTWFWGIFFPIILMVIFMLIFSGNSDEKFKAEIAVVNANPNETSTMLFDQIKQIPVLNIENDQLITREQAEELVKNKDVAAAIVLPETADTTGLQLILNTENAEGATARAVVGILNNFVQQANLYAVGATPTYNLETITVSSGAEDLEYTDFLLTGMIALAVAQGGLFGMVGMVEMRRKGLLKRLRMTPANMGLFGLSDMSIRLVFAIIQLTLLSLIGVFGFGAVLHINVLSLVVVFLIGSLSFNAMGYFFSSFSKTSEAYMGMANIASFLMMFLSGIFFPVETMPDWIQPISHILPLTYFVDGLRGGMSYATGIASADLWTGIGLVSLWGIAAFLLGSWIYKTKSIASAR